MGSGYPPTKLATMSSVATAANIATNSTTLCFRLSGRFGQELMKCLMTFLPFRIELNAHERKRKPNAKRSIIEKK